MKTILLLFTFYFSIIGLSQNNSPSAFSTSNQLATWNTQNKAPGDSCGTYFNNYVGLHKTGLIRQEYLRTGVNSVSANYYNGRAERYHAPQPIEVGGVEFYSYILNNPSVDSLMVITSLNDYDALADSVGTELARDTVYVKHTAFTENLPNLSVQSFFDQPVVVTNDYIVTVFTPTDDSLIIIANDQNTNEGNGEGLSYALYDNSNYPSYYGWYSMLGGDLGEVYDYDFLIAPLVKYKQQHGFLLANDTICENINDACVNYSQEVIFTSNQYNSNSSNSTSSIYWLWGDNSYNLGLSTACHTYDNGGNYSISLNDTLYKWDYNSSYCLIDLSLPIVVLDSANADFTFIQTNSTVDFTANVPNYDSLWWDFGDGQFESNNLTPQHIYSSITTYDVWLHVINQCSEDSIMYQVTTDDVGITENLNHSIKIYPNPATNLLTIDLTNANEFNAIHITDVNGKTIYQSTINSLQSTIDLTNFSNGIYFVQIIGSNDVETIKVVKE